MNLIRGILHWLFNKIPSEEGYYTGWKLEEPIETQTKEAVKKVKTGEAEKDFKQVDARDSEGLNETLYRRR